MRTGEKELKNGHLLTGESYERRSSVLLIGLYGSESSSRLASRHLKASGVDTPKGGTIRRPERSLRGSMGVMHSPRPETSAAGPARKKGTSLPTWAPASASSDSDRGKPVNCCRPESTAAASEEPPPRPAIAGIPFLQVTAAENRMPVRSAEELRSPVDGMLPQRDRLTVIYGAGERIRFLYGDRDLVEEIYLLEDRQEVMESVLPPVQDLEMQVDFCRCMKQQMVVHTGKSIIAGKISQNLFRMNIDNYCLQYVW